MVFLFKHTQNFGVGNHAMFGQYLDNHVAPFISKLLKNVAGYQHLEFCGCGSISLGAMNLEAILGNTYQGQFLKGFDAKEISERAVSIGNDPDFFMPCLNDFSRVQVRANSKEMLEKLFESHNVPTDDRAKILALFDLNKMSETEIRAKCIEIRPYMADMFDTWSGSAMAQFTLTSVGIAIGHANIKRLVGEFANLSIWIN